MGTSPSIGEPARALIAYERLRADLADELGTDPAAVTRDLYVNILRGRLLQRLCNETR